MSILHPQINGQNPLYRVQAIEAMFDQSELPPERRTLPLRPFQKTIIAASTLYNFLDIYAPSQAGKTTAVAALAAELMYEYPGIPILILSTKEDQAKRIIATIRNDFIKCHRIPELRELEPKDGDSSTTLRLLKSRSSVIGLAHSMRAVTGNPARVVILDEMARWDTEDPVTIYTEAFARTGDKPNFLIINISTFFGESIPDPTNPNGFRGSFFHYKWNQAWTNRHTPNKNAAAFRFTYHISPNLTASIDKRREEMNNRGKGYFEEHYLGIPRKVAGKAIFGNDFNRTHHVLPDKHIKLAEDEPLFLCFDPGDRTSAAVLGQLDPNIPRLTYLRAYMGHDKVFGTFVKEVLIKCHRAFPGREILFFMDVAGENPDGKTGTTFGNILADVTGYSPITMRQACEPGVEIMRSYMARTNGFQISDHPDCAILVEALEGGLVCDERNGVQLRKYKKDGYYDHVGDAARYPVYYLSYGSTADSHQYDGPGYYIAHSHYDVL